MSDFVKVPCKHCPFRKDVEPFLHPERGAELALHTQNPYNTFPCHKTTQADEESEEGEMKWVAETKLCAGFLSMQAICDDRALPEKFVPSTELVYEDWIEMADAYGYFDYINQKNAKD